MHAYFCSWLLHHRPIQRLDGPGRLLNLFQALHRVEDMVRRKADFSAIEREWNRAWNIEASGFENMRVSHTWDSRSLKKDDVVNLMKLTNIKIDYWWIESQYNELLRDNGYVGMLDKPPDISNVYLRAP